MITRILSDLARSIVNALALMAALGVLAVGGFLVMVTRWRR